MVYKNGVLIAFFGGLALLIVGLVVYILSGNRSGFFFWLGMIGAVSWAYQVLFRFLCKGWKRNTF
jgi:hypothetical protein